MPRSEKLQRSIDRHRNFRRIPKPPHGERAPISWWLGNLSREEFSERARQEAARMAPNSGIAGDRGVTY